MKSLRVVRSDPEWRGVVPTLDLVTRRIELQNILSVPLTIEVVQKSCGCMRADLSGTEIEPGGYVTMTLASHAAPGFGAQTQTVVFRSRWKREGNEESERGVCSMSFGCETPVIVRPEASVVVADQGSTARALIFVRSPDGVELPAPNPSCTLPGWTVKVMSRPADADAPWVFGASGPATVAGEYTGEVDLWQPTESLGSVKVPLRVRVLSAWVCEPGMAIVTQDKPVIRVKLTRRNSGLPAPVGVKVSRDVLVARITDETFLEVRLAKPTSGPAAAWIDVLGTQGESIARLPVVIHP